MSEARPRPGPGSPGSGRGPVTRVSRNRRGPVTGVCRAPGHTGAPLSTGPRTPVAGARYFTGPRQGKLDRTPVLPGSTGGIRAGVRAGLPGTTPVKQGNAQWVSQGLKCEVVYIDFWRVYQLCYQLCCAVLGDSRCYLGVKITQDRAGRARLGIPCRSSSLFPPADFIFQKMCSRAPLVLGRNQRCS